MRSFGSRIARIACVFALVCPALACGGDDTPEDAGPIVDAAPEIGTVSASWTITDGAVTLSCMDAGAITVGLSLVPVAGGAGEVDASTCDVGMATFRAVPIGTYNAEFVLRGSGGAPLGDPVAMAGIAVTQGGDTALGEIVFTIPPAMAQ